MSLAPLATTYDLEGRLGRSLTSDENYRVTALLLDASASVRGYTGQDFTAGTSTERLKIRYGVVRLPQRPATAIGSVNDVNGTSVTYEWDTRDRLDLILDGWLNSFEREPYRAQPSYVDVTYDHGYDAIPDDIIGVVCGIVLRSFGQVPTETGMVSETIDAYTYRLGSAAASGGYGLLPDERSVLDRYRRVGGTMGLAW